MLSRHRVNAQMRLIPRKTRLIIYNILCSAQIRRRDDRRGVQPIFVGSIDLAAMVRELVPELGKIDTRSSNIEMRLRF